ncbi:hypothetical protein Ddye_008439 [Dipteronia dyeriana]|uniref:EF-hand domain-containing protein n=1 Tax=Dipteronia dyeriana TaxID=168575 RepID=A0AAD9X9T5_9ROSI|nr:hypothetical protein Ddye_008439 [Dipteronia dyeriana]
MPNPPFLVIMNKNSLSINSRIYVNFEKIHRRRLREIPVIKWQAFRTCFKAIHSHSACKVDSGLQQHTGHHASTGDEKNQDFEFCNQQSSFNEKKDDDGSISREEVEMVMGKFSLFCCLEGEELPQRFNSDELSQLFDHEEPSLEEVNEAFDDFDVNKDAFIDAWSCREFFKLWDYKKNSSWGTTQK